MPFQNLITSDTIGKLDRFMKEIWHTLAHAGTRVPNQLYFKYIYTIQNYTETI